MSLVGGLRRIILLEDRVERNAEEVQRLADRMRDCEARLVRVETIIDLARGADQRRLP